MKPAQYNIIINGEAVPVKIRRHKTARHMVIRYQPLHHIIRLTLPRYAGIRQGLHFVEEKREWIAREMNNYARKVALEDGASIHVLGTAYRLRHAGGRGVVKLFPDPLGGRLAINEAGLFESLPLPEQANENILWVPGDAEFFARRVRDWLVKLSGEIIRAEVLEKSRLLGVTPTKISLRDTSSHWGSCNAEGRMSFSWRLVMAPYEVLEYVVCHEVAHLKELNHSKAFWQHVESLCPHWQRSRRWLSAQGAELYSFS